jgi:hypothetical protein
MHSFTAIIQKSGSWGEKTGWTYVDIPQDILTRLKLKSKKEFRIKGFIDDVKLERQAVFPVGEGNYIITLNADLRKKLGKKTGAMVKLSIELDKRGAAQSKELLDCLKDDPEAQAQFESMNMSHQNYFHNYILSAKTETTRTARVVNTLAAMHKKQNFGEMIRSLQAKKQ